MWDPARMSHYCDRCEAEINITRNDFHSSLFTSGVQNTPQGIPEVLKDQLRSFGFKAPMFCFNCVVPIALLINKDCEEFRKKREQVPEPQTKG